MFNKLLVAVRSFKKRDNYISYLFALIIKLNFTHIYLYYHFIKFLISFGSALILLKFFANGNCLFILNKLAYELEQKIVYSIACRCTAPLT